MKRIITIQHCQSEQHINGMMGGWNDWELTELGSLQARRIGERLGAELDKFPMNLQRLGNMSSATIPVLLDELNRGGRLKRGMRLVLSGFGAGLTCGACVMEW